MEWVTHIFGPGAWEHAAGALIAYTIIGLFGWIGAALVWIWSKRKEEKLRRDASMQTQEAIERASAKARADVVKRFRQRYEAALPTLARGLANIIMEPIRPENIEPRARAIVSQRNEMRRSITNLHHLLNDNIDRLERITKDSDKDKKDRRDELIKVMETLQITWKEGKVKSIEIELRRLMAENGLAEIFADDKELT